MDDLPTSNIGEKHYITAIILEQSRGQRKAYARLVALGEGVYKENVCLSGNIGPIMGERSLGEPGIGFFGHAHGDIYGLGFTVYQKINLRIEPGLSTKLLDFFEKRVVPVMARRAHSPVLREESPVMIRDRVYMRNARQNNFVTSTVTAKTVRDKGADTDPCVAAEKFLVDHDGSPKTRLTEVLAVLVRIVIVNGKSVQYPFAQFPSECRAIERTVSTQRAEKSHLFIAYTALLE